MPRGRGTTPGSRGASKRGVFGVVGGHYSLPAMAALLPDVGESQDNFDLSKSSDKIQTRFAFECDKEDLKTYYTPNRGNNRCKSLLMMGVMTFEYRVVDSVSAHTSLSNSSGSREDASSPFKGAVRSKNSSVALVASFAWKNGQEKKKCCFLVKVGRELEKSSYQKVSVKSGDDGGIISIIPKDQDLWKEYITLELSEFEEKVSAQPELIKRYWKRVGLQEEYCSQEDEVYIWNPAVALVCSREKRTFEIVDLSGAGFCELSFVPGLPVVTLCLNKPAENFAPFICGCIGEVHFVTLLCVWGLSVLSCKPHFMLDKLQKKIASLILVGPAFTGKTGLGEIGVTIVGTDKHDGKAFSYNHMSEHEYGKKTLVSFVPITVSDPPEDNSKQYAQLFQHAYDATRRSVGLLTYTPGVAPITCINEDFMSLLRKEESWNVRLRCRIIVLEVADRIAFPADDENIYKRAQCLSYYLPQLLYIDEKLIKASVTHHETSATLALTGTALNDTAMLRMSSNLGLFYAMGEHVAKVLCPDFPFREAAFEHRSTVAIPSALKYQCDTKTARPNAKIGRTVATTSSFTDVVAFIELVIDFSLSNPTIPWYEWIRWDVTWSGKTCFAVRTGAFRNLPSFPFYKNQQAVLAFLCQNPEFGAASAQLVNLRIPRHVKSTGQKKAFAVVFYVDSMEPPHIRRQLLVMDKVSKDTNYNEGWEVTGRSSLAQLAHSEDSESLSDGLNRDGEVSSDNELEPDSSITQDRLAQPFGPTSQNDGFSNSQCMAPAHVAFQTWYQVTGRALFAAKLRSSSLPHSEPTVFAVAKGHWSGLTPTEKKKLTLDAVNFTFSLEDNAQSPVPAESGTDEIEEPTRPCVTSAVEPENALTSMPTLFESTISDGGNLSSDDKAHEIHPVVHSEGGFDNTFNTRRVKERQRKSQRKAPALTRAKKRKTTPCGICQHNKSESQVIPCSLNEQCKRWVCRTCCLQTKSAQWFKERSKSVDYDKVTSSAYFICAADHIV